MSNTRSFCDQPDHEHAIVSPTVEVRDNLGSLAVQVLAAREDLSAMDSVTMVRKLYEIVEDLQKAYMYCLEHDPMVR